MSYRFAKVTTFYPEYLEDYYSRNPGEEVKTYQEQQKNLMAEGFAWANFFETHLRSFGIDAYEIVANAGPMQKAWARENDLNCEGAELVMHQLRALKPTVVMLQDSFSFSGQWVRDLRREVPEIMLVLGWCCTYFNDKNLESFRPFDFILTCSEDFSDELEKAGLKTFKIRHGFEESILPLLDQNNTIENCDVFFAGSFVLGRNYHDERYQLMEDLLQSGIQVHNHTKFKNVGRFRTFLKQGASFSYSLLGTVGMQSVADKVPLVKNAAHWTELPRYRNVSRAFKKSVRPPIYGTKMLKGVRHGKICFNSHIAASKKYAANIRMFEATGAGSCLITDWKPHIREIFEPDKEVVTYKNIHECLEKVRWLLGNENKRREIALAGQKRCLKDHTLKQRVECLHQFISENLA